MRRVAAALIDEFRRARRDPALAVLEGFHALKHAVRFGAHVDRIVAIDPAEVQQLARDLAPDLVETLAGSAERVEPDVLAQLAPHAPRTGVLAIARRPPQTLDDALARPGPIVLLEDPRHLGNVGAVVRVAAAADAAGVLTTGTHDPWHPDALRGAAGLHYALPVVRVDELPPTPRPLIALDPGGEPLATLPADAILAFGTERHGLSDALLARASARLGIPMRSGVSSLNLATSVAAVLFGGVTR